MSAPGALIALLSAQTLSIAGTSLSTIAFPWLVLSTSGSPLGAALMVMTVVFVTGLLRSPSDAAKQSLVPQVARRAGLPLERVTGLAATVDGLVSTLGTTPAFLATGVAYALVTLMPLIRPSFRAFGRPAGRQPPEPDVS